MAGFRKYSSMYINYVLDVLAQEGKRLIVEAYKTKDFIDRSGTLTSNYCYVVLYDGIMYRLGSPSEADFGLNYPNHPWSHKGLKGTGWDDTGDWLADFYDCLGRPFRHIAPAYKHSTQGFELLILNAAYYTQFLEDGSWAKGMSKILGHHVEPKQYKVIAQISSSCQNAAQKITSQIKGMKLRRIDKIGKNGVPLKPNFR